MKSDLNKKRFPFPLRKQVPLQGSLLNSIQLQTDKIGYLLSNYHVDPVTAIHEVRKSYKRLRSIIPLLKPLIPGRAAAWNTFWRDRSRTLSSGREICVRIDSIRMLAGSDEEFKSLLDTAVAIRNRIIFEIDQNGVIQMLKKDMEATRSDLTNLVPADLEAHMLDVGLLSTYEKAKFQLDKALFSSDPEELHELRKRCKRIQYHCELMSRLNPDLRSLNKTISQNTELLGLYNDLNDLEVWGSENHEVISEDSWERLHERITQRKSGLREKSLRQISEILRKDASGYIELYSEFNLA